MILSDYSAFRAEIKTLSGAATLMSVRHEMFFIGVRRNLFWQAVHCALALVRDVWWMVCFLRRRGARGRTPQYAFVASLGGPSGWLTLQPELERLRAAGCDCLVYVHPRLRRLTDALLPVRPPARAFAAAFLAALRAPTPPAGFNRAALGLLLARASLWTSVWKETLVADGLPSHAMVVHNDFDMFLRPAVSAAQDAGPDAVCLQHGAPTAEFFPLTARRHLVWSERMAQVYRADADGPAVVDVMAQRPSLPVRAQSRRISPVVRLISQTHTAIYGRGLGDQIMAFASDAAKEFGPEGFRVLLHPNEADLAGIWHARVPQAILERPPHGAFAPSPDEIRIFVGFSSTAQIEAAANGHLVISLDLPHTDSRAARDVLRTPLAIAPDGAVDLVRSLVTDAAHCEASLKAQDLWLVNNIGWRN
jgi:hypothetical protein